MDELNHSMKNKNSSKYKLLLIGPKLHIGGGVADFCKMQIENMSDDFSVKYFAVGNITQQVNTILVILKFMSSLGLLYNYLRDDNYHIIQINPSFKKKALFRDTLYLFLTIIFAKTSRKVIYFHGWDELFAERINRVIILRRIISTVYNQVDRVYVLYNTCKSQLINIGVNQSKLSVTTTTYDRKLITKTSSDLKKSNSNTIGILYLSRFAKQKGVILSVKICAILESEGLHNFHIAMAGDGELYGELENYVNKNDLKNIVSLEGFVTGERKKHLLQKSDILLFPTNYGEGCPIVVLEAMGAGLAILSTPKGALPSIISNGINGFLVDSTQAEDFVPPLRTLLTDKSLLDRIKKENLRYAESQFESMAYFARMANDYKTLIES